MLYRDLIESHTAEEGTIININGMEFSYLLLDCLVKQTLNIMKQKGIKDQDCVMIIGANNLETVILILACIAGGMIFVPVGSGMPEEKYERIVRNCMPKVIYDMEGVMTGKIHAASPKSEIITKDSICQFYANDQRRYQMPKDEKREIIAPEKLAYILYTSGSTSEPKGVVSRYRQILFCIHAINHVLKNGKADRILSILPITFDYGLYQIFLTLSSGARLYLKEHYVLQQLPGEIARNRITGFPGLPSLFKMMVRTKLFERMEAPELRYITSTGEVFSDELIQQLEQLFPCTYVVPMYGLTECKRVSVMPLDHEIQKIKKGSCGLPLDGVQVWLRDRDEESGIGELVVEGPNVMEGYWNEQEETKRYFVIKDNEEKNILYTGDLFFIDQDGFLYFKERKKRILKIRGCRFGCAELEQFIEQMDDVEECSVFGILNEDGEENAGICVVSQAEFAKERIKKWLEQGYPGLKNFWLWIRPEELPKNEHGKIDILLTKKECMSDGE